MIALAGAAILPLVWLFVSVYYYGDLLPTSFYVKTPKGDLRDLIFNGIYVASYLLFVGIIPVAAMIIALLVPKHRTISVLAQHFKSIWWLYLGLLLELSYGLTMATHHMMFSFRFFVPYIPGIVILVVDLLRRASETREIDLTTGSLHTYLQDFFYYWRCFSSIRMYIPTIVPSTGFHSLGNIGLLASEIMSVSSRILKQEAVDIENHWDMVHEDGGRPPRIITYAAGMLPYTYRESYIYEKLVSYRHCHERYRQGLYADYIHIVVPRQGPIEQQLPLPEDSYDLVSSYKMFFDGSMQEFLVFYNPKPEGHNLSAGINDFCQENEKVLWLDR